jgi:hypothetical protein
MGLDGTQWQPVAGPEPARGAVFAAWNSIKVEPADPVVEAPAPQAPVPIQQAPPAVVYASPAPAVDYGYRAPDVDYGLPVPEAEPEVPLWQQTPDTGVSKYLYFGAALVLMVMVLIVLNSLNYVQLPFIGQSSAPTPEAKASPPAPLTRSEYARADAFLNGSLTPALNDFSKTTTAWQTCGGGTLSNACFAAVKGSEQQLKNILSVIDHGSIPPCIAAPMNKFRADIAGMDAGLVVAIKGFNDGQRPEVVTGLTQFTAPARAVQPDGVALDKAQKASCSTDLEGP